MKSKATTRLLLSCQSKKKKREASATNKEDAKRIKIELAREPEKSNGLDHLTEQEKQHLQHGHGKKGVPMDTTMSKVYFALDNDMLLEVGKKIHVDSLILYSLNRWYLASLSLKYKILKGTRLWIVPGEE